MNINNSSSVGPNLTSPSKATARNAEPKAKQADVEVAKQEAVSAQESVESAQKVEAQEKTRLAKELNQQRLEKEAEQNIEEKVDTAVETIRGFIQENQRDLDFDVAKESNRVIITVKDKVTNEVIRQIPPEDAIELAERIQSGDDITSSGVLLNGEA